MKTSNVTAIEIGTHSVRAVQRNDGDWFVVADVLNAIGVHESAFDSLSSELNESNKDFAQIACDDRLERMAVVHEDSVIDLAFLFDNPEAILLQEWSVEFCSKPTEIGTACPSETSIAEFLEDDLIAKAVCILKARLEAQQKLSRATN